jgi:hypothetical protein
VPAIELRRQLFLLQLSFDADVFEPVGFAFTCQLGRLTETLALTAFIDSTTPAHRER